MIVRRAETIQTVRLARERVKTEITANRTQKAAMKYWVYQKTRLSIVLLGPTRIKKKSLTVLEALIEPLFFAGLVNDGPPAKAN